MLRAGVFSTEGLAFGAALCVDSIATDDLPVVLRAVAGFRVAAVLLVVVLVGMFKKIRSHGSGPLIEEP